VLSRYEEEEAEEVEEEEEKKEEEDPYPKTDEYTPHLYKPVSFRPFIWPRISKQDFSFMFPHQNPMYISLLSHPKSQI
jgi:hypothetical protein